MLYVVGFKGPTTGSSYHCALFNLLAINNPIELLNYIETKTKEDPAGLGISLGLPTTTVSIPALFGDKTSDTMTFANKGDALRFATANGGCSVFVTQMEGFFAVSVYSADVSIGGFFVEAPTVTMDAEDKQDILAELVSLQAAMNDTAFAKQSIHSVASGEEMRTEFFFRNLADPNYSLTANSDTCVWLRNYIWAAKAELDELAELVPQKWWGKNRLNLEAAREEFIDVLHFMLSVGLSLGLDAKGIQDVYRKKNAVNLQRQADGYLARGNG